MCGFVGAVELGSSAPDRRALERAIARIHHRGPDETGFHVAGPVGLAHARLSIIDLANGQQPMSAADGAVTIVFNGEIFNHVELRAELEARGHRFRTRSDTEVLLRSYLDKGEDCVRDFNGQWSFAIWDARRGRLFASRDRLGIRPFFYAAPATGSRSARR